MKLLAVFELALAVAAIDMPTSDAVAIGKRCIAGCLKLLMSRPLLLLNLFKLDPSNPFLCLNVLSMVYEGKIILANNPEVVSPLVRCYLEKKMPLFLNKTSRSRFLDKDPPKMSIVHAAIFIFMFRVKGCENMAERLYNAVMENHFPAGFEAKLHERPYTLDPLEDFKSLKTLNPPKDFECLKTDHERQSFFMLWTVQMYGKGSERQDVRQRKLLGYSSQVALILASMGFPSDLLVAGVILLLKKLLADVALHSLSMLHLMFLSLTRDGYLKLEEPEKTQLRAFLERYLKARWSVHNMLVERPSDQELEQFQRVFDVEYRLRCEFLEPCMDIEFAKHLYVLMQAGCPAFLLKKMFDFCLRESSFRGGRALDKKYCLLGVLVMALEMAREDVCLEVVEGVCPEKALVCSQIECTTLECYSEISALLATFSEENPEAKKEWENNSSARKGWIALRDASKACASLGLSN